jgi:hypothetical protein
VEAKWHSVTYVYVGSVSFGAMYGVYKLHMWLNASYRLNRPIEKGNAIRFTAKG